MLESPKTNAADISSHQLDVYHHHAYVQSHLTSPPLHSTTTQKSPLRPQEYPISLPPPSLTALACSTSPSFLLPHPPDSSSAAAAAHPRSTPPSAARAAPSQCLPHRPSWSSSAAFSLADSSPCVLAAAVSPTGNAHARRRGR